MFDQVHRKLHFGSTFGITATGGAGYLLMLGTAMTVVLLALAVVRRHIPAKRLAA